ncbi:hypothetical protein [Amycolatopsis sp. NPDC098790]|uniref:hypothetical protein n=1 Tax=Amycolatopsis sp. NPDC098790 TaxID=3363939 RepID=UPI0037F9BB4D
MDVLRTEQEEDRALVARLHDGDWSALDVLYGRYARPVFQRCWRILRERTASWETTHDTFAQFVGHLPCPCGRPAREWLLETGTRLATRRAAR